MPQSPTNVVIIGAGVIGLTVAHVLTEGEGSNLFNVTIVARDMPEDLSSQGFASPWAGADWSPIQRDERLNRWEKHTFAKFWSMIPTGLVNGVPYLIYSSSSVEDIEKATSWWREIPRDFRVLPSDYPFPADLISGVQFETFSVNPEVYLPWLKSKLESRGVRFLRRRVNSLDEACGLAGERGVVINATGLGARSLFGVEDTKVYPVRGQTILVYSPNAKECITVAPAGTSEKVLTYVIPRASTPGMVILGGTMEANNWDTSINISTANHILASTKEVTPALNDPATRIHAHNVGLRPAREGGPRVEAQFIVVPSTDKLVPRLSDAPADPKTYLIVHAYGFGSAGYQQSWGAAEEVFKLLKENSPQ
jgi:glycine/D-amino acid oxidase-like deaminating enzyme